MAKKKTAFNALDYDKINLEKIEQYVVAINSIYNEAGEELAELAASIPKINAAKQFAFADYPQFLARFNRIVDKTVFKVATTIDDGVTNAWLRSNVKNDALVNSVLDVTRLPKSKVKQYFERNLSALAETRTPIKDLSKNIFNITKQFTNIAELAIDEGVGKGTGARLLAREIRTAVGDPDYIFRRVRDKRGNLQLSKNAKKFKKDNPDASGRGKALNPQANYERLTRTEINRSYRKADQSRYQTLDFVVGVKINLSNNPNHCPMCEALAGIYPKQFVFIGWHPNCRCYKTTVLKTDDEIEADNVRILNGKQPLARSANSVYKMPDNYNTWVEDNKDRLQAAIKRDKKPYWIRDAYKDGDFSKGVNLGK